jgi:hypothetical protein
LRNSCRNRASHLCNSGLTNKAAWLGQQEIGWRNAKVPIDLTSEHLVVMLCCINHERFNGRRELRGKSSQLDELGSRANDCRDAHNPPRADWVHRLR